MRHVNWSITTRTQRVLNVADSHRNRSVCPKGAGYQWGKDPLEQLMVRFDSYRAVSLGTEASRNLVTKSTIGGRATLQAVTRVKPEQASKAIMWAPTRPICGEGRANWEEPGAGARPGITVRTSWATGVVGTACKEGNLRQWGRLGMVAESGAANVVFRMTDHLGVGEGQRYRRSRITPVEGLCQEGANSVMLCER